MSEPSTFPAAITRIEQLEHKLKLARKGLLWIQVRAACDKGEPLADKIVAVAADHLTETDDPSCPNNWQAPA